MGNNVCIETLEDIYYIKPIISGNLPNGKYEQGKGKLVLRYLHMMQKTQEELDELISCEIIEVGQKIGYVGNTGISTNAHIHFDINTISTPFGDNLKLYVNTLDPINFFAVELVKVNDYKTDIMY